MVLHAEVIIPTHESGPGAGVRRGVTSSDIFPGGAGAAVLECWNAGLLKSHFTCQRSVSTASAPLPLHRRVALTQHSTMGTLAILDYCYAWKLDRFGFAPFCAFVDVRTAIITPFSFWKLTMFETSFQEMHGLSSDRNATEM